MDNNNNIESITPSSKTTGLRSRSNSTPASPTKTPISGKSYVYTTSENARKLISMDTPGPVSGLKKKAIINTPSNIPLPPSQTSSKKDPSKRYSTSFLNRPLTPQPTSSTSNTFNINTNNNNNNISSVINNNKTTTTTTTISTKSLSSSTNTINQPIAQRVTQQNESSVNSTNISELLQNNNLDIISQNQNNSSHSAFNSVSKNTTTSLSSSLNSTPSPTLLSLPNVSLLPPDLSLDGQHNSVGGGINHNHQVFNVNLSPNSQSNNSILNRSSSPSPNGRRTPTPTGSMTPSILPTSFLNPNQTISFLKASQLNSEREESIQVYCRFRPEIPSEKNLPISEKQLTIGEDNRTVHITSQQYSTAYKFSKVFQPSTTQESFYNEVAKPLVEDVLNGFNVGIIAYGQTGAGKTFTQFGQGISDELPLPSQQQQQQQQQFISKEEYYGITPRIVKDLIERIYLLQSDRIRFTVRISYLELYREKLYDLFNNRSELDIRLGGDGHTSFNVPDATQQSISSFQDFLHFIQIGEKSRSYSDNKKNQTSSRSHVLFIVSILKEDLENKDNFLSSLYIVDLAGSESVSQTGATGSRLDETKSINKSLFALGGVIEDMAKKSKHVRYRDSKLTQLLQNCFGGNSKTHLIVNCSYSNNESILRDTTQSLSFAERTQSVKNKPSINVEFNNQQLKQFIQALKNDINHLKKFIESNSSSMGTISPSQISDYITKCQSALDQYKSVNESLVQNVRNLEEDIQYLEDEKRSRELENNKKHEDTNKRFEEISHLFEQSKEYIGLLENERSDFENRSKEYEATIIESQSKYDQLKEQVELLTDDLDRSLKEREEFLVHLNKIKEKNKEFEKEKTTADELRIRLTQKEELIVNKTQEIQELNNQKLKWKNKSHEYLKQKSQLEEQLQLLRTTNDINENEQIKNQKFKLLELQSQLTLSIERETNLKKDIESIKNKNNEQNIILTNLKNQLDDLINKIEINFPTIIINTNNNKLISTANNNNSIESNLIVSITQIENLFEKISTSIVNNQNNQNIISSSSSSSSFSSSSTNNNIVSSSVIEKSIDENDQFIKNEKEKESINLNNNLKFIQDFHSNFLKKQEEIKQLIKDQIQQQPLSSSSSSIINTSGNNKLIKKLKNNNNNNKIKKSNNSNSICINILIGIFGIIVLFFLMVGVGLIIQRHDKVNGSNYYYKAT